MMQMLRKAAAFIMFAILIGAFAISMGGNNYFDRNSQQTVAKVGSTEISPQDFQRAYQRFLNDISARNRRRISPQEAQAYGMPERVLQSLIQDAALDENIKKLRLGLSSDGLKHSLYGNESFQDEHGKFSPEKYQQVLQQIGYSALFFEQEYKADVIRRQIRSIFEKSAVLPKTLLTAFNNYYNEERTVSFFALAPQAAGTIDTPADDVLRSFYDERKAMFMAPEYRKVDVMAIAPDIAALNIQISDEEVKAKYDANPKSYGVPERRDIEVIAFQTRKAAEDAVAEIKSGKDFMKVAEDAGFKPDAVKIGSVSRKEFADKFSTNDAILDAAFSLKRDEVSAPVDGPLSTVVMRVTGMVDEREKSLDEVKPLIRDELLKARAAQESARLIKAFEEERTAGISIADGAKKLGLHMEQTTIDRSGVGPDGKPVALTAVMGTNLAAAAFKSDVGVENEALRLQHGGYAWFEVQEIIKPRQKSFEEVKAEVEKAWKNEQVRIKLIELAKTLADRVSHGETLADVAKSIGVEPITSQPLKRESKDPQIPPTVISQAFALNEGAASSAASPDGISRVFFQVTKVTPAAPLDEAGTKAMEQRLAGEIANDNFSEYLKGVTKVAGVTVDRKTLTAVLGGAYGGEE